MQTGSTSAWAREISAHCALSKHDKIFFPEQVLLLSEGHQLYFGPPQEAVNWFSNCLGYALWPGQHGAEADWLMDLVSVGFSKPQALRGASMTSREDVAKASKLWHAHCRKARHCLMTILVGLVRMPEALPSCTCARAGG